MKRLADVCLRVFVLFCSIVTSLSAGQSTVTGSSRPIVGNQGDDVILPCLLDPPVKSADVAAVEWSRVDVYPAVTLLISREGKELPKERAREYDGRTAMLGDGLSLRLSRGRRQDSGTYRCYVRLKGQEKGREALAHLVVAVMSDPVISITQTSDQLFLHCESRGWDPEPEVTWLGPRGAVLPAGEPVKGTPGPDGLYYVNRSINVAEAQEMEATDIFICRVHVPNLNLAKENQFRVTGRRPLAEAGFDFNVVYLLLSIFAAAAALLVMCFLPVSTIQKLRSSLQTLTAIFFEFPANSRKETDYGDIMEVETTGASDKTAQVNNLSSTGVEASEELARRDLEEMEKHKEIITTVGDNRGVHPGLIAAIISRQSRAGVMLKSDGYGLHDTDCFGLMQVHRRYHTVRGLPFSKEHVDQGTEILIKTIETMRSKKSQWSPEEQLKGAIAAYIAGPGRVLEKPYDEVDSVTPYEDFANDVVARAQWFARNGFFPAQKTKKPEC